MVVWLWCFFLVPPLVEVLAVRMQSINPQPAVLGQTATITFATDPGEAAIISATFAQTQSPNLQQGPFSIINDLLIISIPNSQAFVGLWALHVQLTDGSSVDLGTGLVIDSNSSSVPIVPTASNVAQQSPPPAPDPPVPTSAQISHNHSKILPSGSHTSVGFASVDPAPELTSTSTFAVEISASQSNSTSSSTAQALDTGGKGRKHNNTVIGVVTALVLLLISSLTTATIWLKRRSKRLAITVTPYRQGAVAKHSSMECLVRSDTNGASDSFKDGPGRASQAKDTRTFQHGCIVDSTVFPTGTSLAVPDLRNGSPQISLPSSQPRMQTLPDSLFISNGQERVVAVGKTDGMYLEFGDSTGGTTGERMYSPSPPPSYSSTSG